MNIGIFYPEYSRLGGIERVSTELADGAAQSGHEVHYYGVRQIAPASPDVKFHNIRIIPVPHSLALATFAFSSRRVLRQSRHDITQSFGGVVGCDVVTAQSCHLAGLQAMNSRDEEVDGTRQNWGIADRIRLSLERRIYAGRNYKHVTAVSEGVKQELMSLYGVPAEDITVIPNGVDLKAFNPELRMSKRGDARAQLGISDGEFVVLFVGNEFRRKGLKFLISALATVPNLPLKLVVAGQEDPKPYQEFAAEEHLGNRVIFVGHAKDMSVIYPVADIFVLPTAYEANSLALLEAAGSGLPIITTRVNGATDLIQDGVNGVFVERDSYMIADAISMLMHNRSLAERLARSASESVKDYSWDRIVKRTLNVYEEVWRHKKQEHPHD